MGAFWNKRIQIMDANFQPLYYCILYGKNHKSSERQFFPKLEHLTFGPKTSEKDSSPQKSFKITVL